MNNILDRKVMLFKSLRESFIPGIKFYTKLASTSTLLPKLSRFINKYFYKFGLASSICRYDNTFTIYSSKRDSQLYSDYDDNDIFCNFGSGAFFHNRWLNFDYEGKSSYYKSLQGIPHKDYTPINICDINFSIDLDNNSVSLIYLSHTLEHIEKLSAIAFLKECFRVLKKDGVLRIAVPSTDNDQRILSIISKQAAIDPSVKFDVASQAAAHLITDSENIDHSLVFDLALGASFNAKKYFDILTNLGVSSSFTADNPSRHISFWDYYEILSISNCIGFTACLPFYRGASLKQPFTNLHVFDTTEPHISLYVELLK